MTPAAPETPAAPKTADATAAPAAPAAPARLQLCEPGSGAGPGPRAAASAAAAAAAAGEGGELRGGVPAEASLVKYTLLVHTHLRAGGLAAQVHAAAFVQKSSSGICAKA